MKLIIFDLDQTLVDFISVHDAVTRKLFQEFFNVEASLTEIDFPGKSLSQCFEELARLKNVPDDLFRDKSQRLLQRYETLFIEAIPEDASKYVLSGAMELLEKLSKTEHIIVLYTGEPPGIVGAVFRATGLGKYFKFCFYGTEVNSRADMVRMAIEKARQFTGKKFENKDTVIIGDSVRDVQCGKIFNALTIAVATGFHSKEELSSAHPDYLLNNLQDYARVLSVIK